MFLIAYGGTGRPFLSPVRPSQDTPVKRAEATDCYPSDSTGEWFAGIMLPECEFPSLVTSGENRCIMSRPLSLSAE